ncbi:MAG: TonB-dependent receptor [Verrucomicrobia bacterium]|nr:MAG: TonB-dependent receptor [Verrucomicrobiota bacterium]
MVKTMAVLFGVVFLVVGILGFVPAVTKDQMLLGIFHVNTAHNAVHLLSGVVALLCGMSGAGASRWYFRIFGLVYGAVAVMGFMAGGDTMLLGLISNNMADTWLHVGIAAVSLLLGFMPASTETA